jgi:hypothetical protein
MPLVPCRVCEWKVSQDAEFCPNCGAKKPGNLPTPMIQKASRKGSYDFQDEKIIITPAKRRKTALIAIAGLGIVIIAFIILFIGINKQTVYNNKIIAYNKCIENIKQNYLPRDFIEFYKFTEGSVNDKGEGVFEAHILLAYGKIKTPAPFEGNPLKLIICTYKIQDDQNWQLIDLLIKE